MNTQTPRTDSEESSIPSADNDRWNGLLAMEQRYEAMEKERDMWKANHDNQVKLKSALLDRPDLQDRARSLQLLHEELNEATLNNNLHEAREAAFKRIYKEDLEKWKQELAETKAKLAEADREIERLNLMVREVRDVLQHAENICLNVDAMHGCKSAEPVTKALARIDAELKE